MEGQAQPDRGRMNDRLVDYCIHFVLGKVSRGYATGILRMSSLPSVTSYNENKDFFPVLR